VKLPEILESIPHPVDATLHGATDYTVGSALTTWVPRLFGVQRTAAGRQLRAAGAAHIGYSLLTDYPLGAVRKLPYQAHLAMDVAGAVALGALPILTGQWRQGRRQWLPQVGVALFELGALALSDPTGRGSFHGDVDAVRSANTESPETKIRGAGPAVRRAAAVSSS
jgi:hypothetical protein